MKENLENWKIDKPMFLCSDWEVALQNGNPVEMGKTIMFSVQKVRKMARLKITLCIY